MWYFTGTWPCCVTVIGLLPVPLPLLRLRSGGMPERGALGPHLRDLVIRRPPTGTQVPRSCTCVSTEYLGTCPSEPRSVDPSLIKSSLLKVCCLSLLLHPLQQHLLQDPDNLHQPSPPSPALRATRIRDVRRKYVHPHPPSLEEWSSMLMFLRCSGNAAVVGRGPQGRRG